MYLLLTFRLETVFRGSVFEMNSRALWIYRSIFCILAVAINIGVVRFLPKIEAQTKSGDISLCTANTGFTRNLGDISIIASVILDIIITSLLVSVFVHKLRQV